MHRAAGQLPHEPGVDGAEGERARTGPFGGAWHMLQEPAELGAREVRIEHEAGLRPDAVREAARAQLLAERGGAPILPHDGAVHRPAAPPLPEDGGLALVRDAERRHVARAYPRAPARLAEHAQRDPPDLLYIVLDPPRLRVVLRELRVGTPDDAPLAVEHEHGRARGPLIDRDDDGHQEAVRVTMASEANEPGSESGKRSDDRRGVAEATPQEGGASTPLAAPGSFAAAAMVTRTASSSPGRATAGAAGPRGRGPGAARAPGRGVARRARAG